MTDFSFSSTAEQVTEGISLAGKNILITGVNSGLGKESARVLAMRGANIIGLARSAEKAEAAFAELGITGDAVACELSEPSSVRAAVQAVLGLNKKLDVMLFNAGIMALPERKVTQGLELQFMTNHMGHFILGTGLLDALSDDGRVVVVSSGAHHMAPDMGIDFDDLSGEATYEAWRQYGQSKLANVLFARVLNKRFDGTKKMACSLHPGVIKTNLGRNNPTATNAFFTTMDPATIKTIPQGAATQCLLAARPEAADAGGLYYADCQPKKTNPLAQDDALADRLWTESEALAARLA